MRAGFGETAAHRRSYRESKTLVQGKSNPRTGDIAPPYRGEVPLVQGRRAPRTRVGGNEDVVGGVQTCEWLKYTVGVRKAGRYRVKFHYGTPLDYESATPAGMFFCSDYFNFGKI